MKYVVEDGKEKLIELNDNDVHRTNEANYNHQLHQAVKHIGHWFTGTSSECLKIFLISLSTLSTPQLTIF